MRRLIRAACETLLNARGRRCRVHVVWRTERADLTSAQRPGASLSSSPKLLRAHRLGGFTAQRPGASLSSSLSGLPHVALRLSPAQRPGASLSSSLQPALINALKTILLNARGRRCRVHGPKGAARYAVWHLLNARGRRCRVHLPVKLRVGPVKHCSTPGGVVVEFTVSRRQRRSGSLTAQRPGASLSSSLRTT